ncbi:unnamed protein product [Gongylonema pulchrum]|uniref:Fibronectin type-III domain-containing protein n=1 Tax=Gongylonema pulchrum TaxID=637853 RepID=A0A183EWT1_9BILA|nr:unnamed protein product [Gongylonema pulchrum]
MKELSVPGPRASKQLAIDAPRAFISGRNVRVLWALPKDHPDLDEIVEFQIKLRAGNGEKEWILSDVVDGHVRAVTVKALLPQNRYQFRVLAKMKDQSVIFSPPTDWLQIGRSEGKNDQDERPNITLFTAISDTALQLHWNYTVPVYIDSPESFLISFTKASNKKYTHTRRVNDSSAMIILSDLEPSSEYRAIVEVELADKISLRSEPAVARTMGFHLIY